MFRVTIQAIGRDEEANHIVSDLAARYFPGERLVRPSPLLCVLTVDGPQADLIIDTLREATEDPSFAPWPEWEQRKADQFPIVFDSPNRHIEDPIDQTAG